MYGFFHHDRPTVWLASLVFLAIDSAVSFNARSSRDSVAKAEAKAKAIQDQQFLHDRVLSKRNVDEIGDRANVSQAGKGKETATKIETRIRVPVCCPLESRLTLNGCGPANGTFHFPPLYTSSDLTLTEEAPGLEYLDPYVRDPCVGRDHYKLDPEEGDVYMFLDNSSIYYQNFNNVIVESDYCFAVVDTELYDVVLCHGETRYEIAFPVGLIVSVPFLFATFLTYTLLPELNNMHGKTLRGYVGPLLVAYVILAVVQITPQRLISDPVCVAFAFIIHFSFLASFFWLNVMCFDIWWTFGGFRSLQGSVRQRERKKFLMYSIYAWGSASLLTSVCILMDFLPNIPHYFVKPQFGVESCWFTTDKAKAIYFYGPMGVTVLCNVCLFISTALKILKHKKDTAHQLKGVDSRRHDDNKQWFNLYLKLFIVMGINWSMEIISWLCNNSPTYLWYLTDLTNTLQGVIIFLIFVWKDKIRRLLVKRFNCHGRNFLSRNSTRSVYHSSTSRTCTTSAAPPQDKMTNEQTRATYPDSNAN